MKKLLFILFLFVSFQSFGQRFPSIDSLQSYILKYFRNSTVETFTNLRGQNIVYGTTEFLEDIVSGSGVDSIWIVDGGSNADTLRYRRWGVTYSAGLISGGAGSQDLQSVTDIGNFTTGSIRSGNSFKMYDATNTTVIGEWINNSNARSELYIYNTSTGRQSLLANNLLEFKGTGFNYQAIIPFATPSAAYTSFMLPNTAAVHRYFPMTFKLNGTTVAAGDTGLVDLGTVGGSTSLNNVGTGYDLAQQGTDNVKRLAMGFGMVADSTSTEVTLRVDTADVATVYSVDTAKANIRAEMSTEGVTYGTVVQRLAIDTSTLAEGHQYYQTDQRRGKYEFSSEMGWRFIGSPEMYIVNDQFAFEAGAVGSQHTASVSGTGAVARFLTFNNARYDSLHNRGNGIWELGSGTTTTGYAAMWTNNSNFGVLRSSKFYSEYRFWIDSLSTTTDGYMFQVGIKARGAFGSGQNEALFYYSDTTFSNTGTWGTLTTDGAGAVTRKDTGVPAVARTWIRLGVEWYSDVPTATYRARFYINDILVSTHERISGVGDNITELVEGGSHVTSSSIRKRAGTINRQIFFDYANAINQHKQ